MNRPKLQGACVAACLALLLAGPWPALAQPAAKPGAARAAPAGKARPKPAPRPKPAAPAPAADSAAVPAGEAAGGATPAGSPVRQADYIVAVVNTEPITNQEVRARAARAERDMRARGEAPPPPAELRKEILDRLISERALLQYARETGLKVDAPVLAQAELAVARQNQLHSVEELHRRVEQEGISVRDFQDDLRNQVLLSRLREREIDPRQRVTDAEIDAFIREQTGARTSTPEINLAMILVAVPEGASAAERARLKERADEVARRARAGEDFAGLALEFSDANNRGRDGGVLGLRPVDKYPDLFITSTQGLRVGEIAGPVSSPAGWHVLKVLERKINRDLPEVRIPQTRVRHILLKTGPAQSEQVARERLADYRRRIQSGQASFAELAREHSQDASAADGGELGWVSPGQFPPELEQAMNNLDQGQISEPVATRFGVQLIQVEGRREQVLTGAEQRQLARNLLREKKAADAFDAWAREVRGRAYVEMREPPR